MSQLQEISKPSRATPSAREEEGRVQPPPASRARRLGEGLYDVTKDALGRLAVPLFSIHSPFLKSARRSAKSIGIYHFVFGIYPTVLIEL